MKGFSIFLLVMGLILTSVSVSFSQDESPHGVNLRQSIENQTVLAAPVQYTNEVAEFSITQVNPEHKDIVFAFSENLALLVKPVCSADAEYGNWRLNTLYNYILLEKKTLSKPTLVAIDRFRFSSGGVPYIRA